MKNNLYTIPAHEPFVDTLARWILARHGDPLALSRALVLLPSRRAALALREAFARVSDGVPLLLPRMQPLGDVDEDMLLPAPLAVEDALAAPPPAFATTRLFVLAQLIARHRAQLLGHTERADHALRLAEELARLLDEMEREQVSLDGLAALVPDAFAAHWQETVEFLQILSQFWPQIAKEEGLVSPEAWRNRRLAVLARHWREHPPEYPVIAAGTTGSIPATAELLAVIAELPQGAVVLPGLDVESDDDYFSHVSESHPQWGMAQLLSKLRYERKHVQVIGAGSERARLMAEVMRPAETSQQWQRVKLDMPAALAGLKLVACAHLQEEATVIALMLRETLETPKKTAALITHDRALARRVAMILQRFGIAVDDSAGLPLAQAPAAAFLRLILDVAASDAAPVALLSLLKHPLAQAGLERIACLEAARTLELKCLRGARVPRGLAALKAVAAAQQDMPADVFALLDNLIAAFAPLTALFVSRKRVALPLLVQAHMQCAELLAGEELSGPEGEALAALVDDIRVAAAHAGAAGAQEYPHLFEALLGSRVLRAEYGTHPRVKILSPIEARMQSFDRIVLGGLNEGSWPMEPQEDPWFNRAMRRSIGLPVPERRIGLAAHDFYMLACAPQVILTRSEKTDGVPATPARWLIKLDVLLGACGMREALEYVHWTDWAAALDAPEHVQPCAPPAPRPPLNARPRAMSVTRIETWMRDPYAIYAEQILGLHALDPLEQELSMREFGSCVHRALERFVKAYPAALPADAYEKLVALGHAELSPLFFNAAVKAWWWPRFERIAKWVVEQEQTRRAGLARVSAEQDYDYTLDGFTLTGRADRVEHAKDGSLAIVDYKTGTPPSVREVEAGLASQLVLLALMSQENVKRLEYWQLQGGETAGKVTALPEAKIAEYMEAAREGLQRLIAKYSNPDFPYRATPVASRASRYSDYDHLARIKEWG